MNDCCRDHDPINNHKKSYSLLNRALNWLHSKPKHLHFALTANLPKAKLNSKRIQDSPHHKPLENPQWRNAEHAEYMCDNDPVLGLYMDGNSWALPWWIHKKHHVANLILKDKPIVIKLCEVCSGASAFEAILNDQRLRFQTVGRYKWNTYDF